MPRPRTNRPRGRTRALAALVLAAGALCARDAAAFCRSTTCTGTCPRDEHGCKTTGAKLAWPSMCVGVSLQTDGTANIPMVQVRKVIAASFVAWSDLDCDGEPATIAFAQLDDVGCHRAEYNEDSGNANVVLFQDTNWEYDSVENNLAKTTVTFDPESGEIFDADIEINHAFNQFTVSDQNVVYDLQSVVTHEVGHFIGLDHSDLYEATMTPGYDEGTTELRTLDVDDIDAACAAYPSTRQVSCDPEPRNGLAYDCSSEAADEGGGCSVAPAETGTSRGEPGQRAAGAALLGFAVAVRRRKRSRVRRSGRRARTTRRRSAAVGSDGPMRSLFLALGLTAVIGAAVAACGDSEADGDTYCPAGQPIYCECANGDSGTRDCNADGTGFAGPCFADSGGVCPERDEDDNDDTSSSSDPSSSGDPGGPGGGGPGSGGAGGGAGTGELFAACTGDGDCASNRCAPDGYCTKECASYEECDWPFGDCPKVGVPADSQQLCAPTCGIYPSNRPQPAPTDCDAFGLYCGYAKAADGAPVLVCGSWPDGISLPPGGADCNYDSWESLQCNLGHSGMEVVCYIDVCVSDACYVDDDCPLPELCSSNGSTLGTCG